MSPRFLLAGTCASSPAPRSRAVASDTSVLLADTLGELLMLYAACDVAFVAGSLAPIGGHNLLEPAVLGKPIIVGPHNFNAADIAAIVLAQGAGGGSRLE